MAELDRVLDVLLHDLRSPLSVASGYVRLLRLERLDSFEARDKAWNHTATALTRIAHMCDEAVGFLPSHEGARRPVAVSTLAARVRQRCLEAGLVYEEPAPIEDGPLLHSSADVDQLAHAVATIAGLQHSPERPVQVRLVLDQDHHEVRFHIPLDAATDTTDDTSSDAPFDPWKKPGLATALACHVISLAAGQVRTGRDLVITFPLQEYQS